MGGSNSTEEKPPEQQPVSSAPEASKPAATPAAAPESTPAEVKSVEPAQSAGVVAPPAKAKSKAEAKSKAQAKGKGKGKEAGKGKEGGEGKSGKGEGKKGKSIDGVQICIMNVAKDATNDQFKTLFEPYGTIKKVDLKFSNEGGCRGFGFITYSCMEEANKAISEMHEKPMGDKKLVVKLSDYQQGTGKAKDDGKGTAKGKAKGQGKAAGKGQIATSQAYGYPDYSGYAYGGMPIISAEALQLQGYTQEQIAQAQAQYMAYMAQAFYGSYGGLEQSLAMPAEDKSAAGKGKKTGDAEKDAKPPPDPNKEFEGHIKSLSEKHGYGFISCPETKSEYNRDVFVDLDECIAKGAGLNDKVKFNVHLSAKGHPRALNMKKA